MEASKTGSAITLEYIGSLTDIASTNAKSIKSVLEQCDNDFIPPLSCRESSTAAVAAQCNLHARDIQPYFEQVLAQKNIVAYSGNDIVALMSFRHNFPNHFYFPTIVKEDDVINYVTTICVLEKYRGYSLAKRLYDFIENVDDLLPTRVYGTCIATRTWETNGSHIKILDKRGYTLTCTLHGDRYDEIENRNISTVYYCKRLAI
jgi:ribosomal protein S18 acetylase RimI-like enzyme